MLHPAQGKGVGSAQHPAPQTTPQPPPTFLSHPEDPGGASQDGGDAHQPAGVGTEPPPQLPS